MLPRTLAAWSLIASLAAAPAVAQDTTGEAAPEEGAEPTAPAQPATPPEAPTTDAPATEGPAPDAPADEAPADDAPPATGEASEGEGDGLGLSLGQDGQPGEPQVGEVYVRENFTDWELRCERVGTGEDPCQLYQLLEDQEGNAVAEISVFALPEGTQQAAAGATIVTPLMTLLTEQLTLSIDGGTAKRYPFSWCSAIGCIARVGFTEQELQQFRRGSRAQLAIVPAAAPDEQVELGISLSGFTAGFEAASESGIPGE